MLGIKSTASGRTAAALVKSRSFVRATWVLATGPSLLPFIYYLFIFETGFHAHRLSSIYWALKADPDLLLPLLPPLECWLYRHMSPWQALSTFKNQKYWGWVYFQNTLYKIPSRPNLKILLIYVNECLCAMCLPDTQGGQKGAWNPLELKFQKIGSCHAGDQTCSLDRFAISPTLIPTI